MDNVEVARRGLELWSEGDIDAALESIHPEIEWHVAFRLPDLPADREVCHGRDEVRELWLAFRSVWTEITVRLEEVLWEGPETVVSRARFRGRGEGSGIEVDRVLFYVMDLRDGLLLRMRTFDTEAEARRAGAPDA